MDISALNISEAKLKQLKRAGFNNIESLANLYPRKYRDFRVRCNVTEIKNHIGEEVRTLAYANITPPGKCVRGILTEGKTAKLSLIWFNQSYLLRSLAVGQTYIVGGVIQYDAQYKSYSIVSPSFCTDDLQHFKPIRSIYPRIKGMSVEYQKTPVFALA